MDRYRVFCFGRLAVAFVLFVSLSAAIPVSAEEGTSAEDIDLFDKVLKLLYSKGKFIEQDAGKKKVKQPKAEGRVDDDDGFFPEDDEAVEPEADAEDEMEDLNVGDAVLFTKRQKEYEGVVDSIDEDAGVAVVKVKSKQRGVKRTFKVKFDDLVKLTDDDKEEVEGAIAQRKSKAKKAKGDKKKKKTSRKETEWVKSHNKRFAANTKICVNLKGKRKPYAGKITKTGITLEKGKTKYKLGDARISKIAKFYRSQHAVQKDGTIKRK